MIKVTGFLNADGTYYKDPHLRVVSTVYEKIATVVYVLDENMLAVGSIGYEEIAKQQFDNAQAGENICDQMISRIEDFIMSDLQDKNPDCTFEKTEGNE